MKSASAWKAGCSSDTGLHREKNEDRIFADAAAGVFLVVDGLGGHAAGEHAAETAVTAIAEFLDSTDGPPEKRIREAITAANNSIYELAKSNQEWEGMACVLTLALVTADAVTVGHVGDSRLYLMWNGNLRKLTPDHSPVGEREDRGELTESEAMFHPRRNEVFRDVGTRPRSAGDSEFIEVRTFPFHPSAALLLCSDGLSDVMTAAEIAEVMELYDDDPDEIAELLVDAANEHGGIDNVSVIFIAGEDFIGMRSPAMADARMRHNVTRTKRSRTKWRRFLNKASWLVIGILLGMGIFAAGEKFLWRIISQ
jgi:serine/threonine protein phosphatase PrpC